MSRDLFGLPQQNALSLQRAALRNLAYGRRRPCASSATSRADGRAERTPSNAAQPSLLCSVIAQLPPDRADISFCRRAPLLRCRGGCSFRHGKRPTPAGQKQYCYIAERFHRMHARCQNSANPCATVVSGPYMLGWQPPTMKFRGHPSRRRLGAAQCPRLASRRCRWHCAAMLLSVTYPARRLRSAVPANGSRQPFRPGVIARDQARWLPHHRRQNRRTCAPL